MAVSLPETKSTPKWRRYIHKTPKMVKSKGMEGDSSFSKLWKVLQNYGWKYRQRQQLYGMVYVPPPPEGSTDRSSECGKNFFLPNDEIWDEARKRNLIDGKEWSQQNGARFQATQESNTRGVGEDGSVSPGSPQSTAHVSPSSSEENDENEEGHDDSDDSRLCGKSRLLTLRSTRVCSGLVRNYLGGGFDQVLFHEEFVCPVVGLIARAGQGGATTMDLWLGPSHVFLPPMSKRVKGTDSFKTEHAVVRCVLDEVERTEPSSFLGCQSEMNAFREYLSSFENECSLGRRERRSRKPQTAAGPATLVARKKRAARGRIGKLNENESCSSSGANNQGRADEKVAPSQSAIEGAGILVQMNKRHSAEKRTVPAPQYEDVACEEGVDAVRRMRSCRGNRRASSGKEIVETRGDVGYGTATSSPSKVRSSSRNPQDEFHMSQSPDGFSPPFDGGASRRRTHQVGERQNRPLEGLFFLTSGVENGVPDRVKNLGGTVLQGVEEVMKMEKVKGKVFFLSSPTCRRRTKYLFAVSRSLPMLHESWLADMEEKGREVSAFDSDLYSSKRLPVGLSNESGLFLLQRARHATHWREPAVFDGLRLAVSLEKRDAEKEWGHILSASGATVVDTSAVGKGDCVVDAVLVDTVSLPPHVTAVPSRVARALGSIGSRDGETPFLDLSWAIQCVIQRKKLEFDGVARYQVSRDILKNSTAPLKVFAIKVKVGPNLVRYEVGDAVKFGKNRSTSIGTIVAIKGHQRGKRTLEVRILERNGNFVLADGGDNGSHVNINEGDLRGHVVLLSSRDFEKVRGGYVPESDENTGVFKLKKGGK